MNNWMESLKQEELKSMEPVLYIFEDPTDALQYMCKEGQPRPYAAAIDPKDLFERQQKELNSRPSIKYWSQVQEEVLLLICTKDEKYSELRTKLKEAEEQSTKGIVAIISAFIGGILGVEAGIISGFVVVLLHTILKLGKEAFCTIHMSVK